MRTILITLLLTILKCLCAEDPWSDGPHEAVRRLYLMSLTGLNHELDVWAPDAPGKVPILYMMGGFGTLFPGDLYGDVWKHLVSHGVVVIQPWVIGNPAASYEPEWVMEVIQWSREHLQDKLHGSGLDRGLELDFDNIIIAGHSSGAHVEVEFLKHYCDTVKGQILFSPVDGVDPFGLIHDFAITPGQYVNYGLPTLMLMAGLDSVQGGLAGDLTPPCVPEDLGNMRFYDAMPAKTWLVNATAYGHGDVINEFYYEGLVETQFCGTDPSQDRVVYRNFVAGEMWAFMNIILQRDCSYLPYIEDSSLMPVNTITAFKEAALSGLDWECGMESKCLWSAAHLIE